MESILQIEGPRAWVYKEDEMTHTKTKVRRAGIEQTTDRKFFNKGLYILIASNGLCKIGRSNNLYQRIASLWTMIPDEFEVYALFSTDKHIVCEKVVHRKYEDRRVKGEWFVLTQNDLDELLRDYGFSLIKQTAKDFLETY